MGVCYHAYGLHDSDFVTITPYPKPYTLYPFPEEQ